MKFLHMKLVFFFSFFSILIIVLSLNLSINHSSDTITFERSKQVVNGQIADIFINNHIGVYDKKSNTYYFSIDDSPEKYLHKIVIKSGNDYKYKILKKSDEDDKVKIIIYNKTYYQIAYIVFRNISLISIKTPLVPLEKCTSTCELDSINYNVDSYDDHSAYDIQFSFNNVRNSFSLNSGAISSIRGSSSSLFEKKSYKIKLKKEYSLIDNIYDNVWILDSLYLDSSKIRNKLSSDLWSDINNNQAISNDLETLFVELYINNEYNGLYVLKNKVDNKSLKLNDNGILIKGAYDFNDENKEKMFNKDFDYVDGRFLNFELKSPKTIDSSIYVDKFVDNINQIRSNYDYVTLNRKTYFENYINYNIFIIFILGFDNINKNYYFSMQNLNSKLLITPWDMDLTFGNNWDNDTFNHESFNMDNSFDKYWMEENIIKYMDVSTFESVSKRYWELRKDVITMDNIGLYLDSYKELLTDSGATTRDSERWYDYDINVEIEKIRKWVSNRITFLDEYFK